MQHSDFLIFKKHAYGEIWAAENRLNLELPPSYEEFLAVCWARWLPRADLGKQPISTRFLELAQSTSLNRGHEYQLLGEECLLQHSMGLNKTRWPTRTYYKEWGQLSLEVAAKNHDPIDVLLEKLARDFSTLAKVLNQCVKPKCDLW